MVAPCRKTPVVALEIPAKKLSFTMRKYMALYIKPGNRLFTIKPTVPYMQVGVKGLLAFLSLPGSVYPSGLRQ
jgi:hypothetical protein